MGETGEDIGETAGQEVEEGEGEAECTYPTYGMIPLASSFLATSLL